MSSTLNNLGQYVFDSIEGYRNAHDRSDSPALKSAFASRIDRREATLTKINQGLMAMGEERITSGSTTGKFHEMWGAVLNALGAGDQTVVSHVEEGEDFLKERFQDALKDDDLDPRERDVITSCMAEIAEGEMFADQLERTTD